MKSAPVQYCDDCSYFYQSFFSVSPHFIILLHICISVSVPTHANANANANGKLSFLKNGSMSIQQEQIIQKQFTIHMNEIEARLQVAALRIDGNDKCCFTIR